jgi:FkbM family methyltransferase
MPLLHRGARALATRGWRGGGAYWALAERLRPWPASPRVEVAPGLWMPADRDDWISANVYRGLYERAELALLPRLVPASSLVVDVGANRGLYTAVLSRLVGPGGTVVAVEPSQRCLPELYRLVEKAALDNVVVHPVALASDAGEARLSGVDRWENSGLATLRAQGEAPEGAGVTVRTRRLEDLEELAGERPVAFLKIDVEGFEPEVLAGGWSLFRSGRVKTALIEITPGVASMDVLAARLRDAEQYTAYRVREGGLARRRPRLTPVAPDQLSGDGSQYNLLLVHRSMDKVVLPLVTREA